MCEFTAHDENTITQLIRDTILKVARENLLDSNTTLTVQLVISTLKKQESIEAAKQLRSNNNEPEATIYSNISKEVPICDFGDTRHDVCPALGKRCTICKKRYYLAVACKKDRPRSPNRNVYNLEEVYTNITDTRDELCTSIYYKNKYNDLDICVKLDTGAQVNVMPNTSI